MLMNLQWTAIEGADIACFLIVFIITWCLDYDTTGYFYNCVLKRTKSVNARNATFRSVSTLKL